MFEGGLASLTDVSLGDRVRVVGTVTEYFGQTEIEAASVTVVEPGHLILGRTPGTEVVDEIADLDRIQQAIALDTGGHLLDEIRTVRATGLTFAPEAGTQRMRDGVSGTSPIVRPSTPTVLWAWVE